MKEKKVYVIGTPEWHSDFVQKVFSSKEKALEYQKKTFEELNRLNSSGYVWEDYLKKIYEYPLDEG